MSIYYFDHLKEHEVKALRAALVHDVRFYHSSRLQNWRQCYKRDVEIAILIWIEALGGLGAVW